MRLVVDAMGSDHFPVPDVAGAVEAANAYRDTIILVGDEGLIREELTKHVITDLDIHIHHATEYITQDDSPTQAGRSKPNSTMHIGCRMVRDGEADAFITAGNTGAALAISTLFTLKRIPGVARPMLTALVNLPDHQLIMGDIGANVDCKPEWLVQFAQMGDIYSRIVLDIERPRIGLLANGEEQNKGNEAIKAAYTQLQQTNMNFVGNFEPKDALNGAVDVIIHDGLVGNVFMKSMEAFGSLVFNLIRKELSADTRAKLGGALGKPAFRRVYKQIDPFEIGGTLLLGVDGVVIIAHGRTNALGMKNSIRQAREAVQSGVITALHDQFAKPN